MKKMFFVISLILLSGCRSFYSSEKVIDMKEFRDLIDGKFTGVKEVLNLFPKGITDVESRVEYLKTFAIEELTKILNIDAQNRTFDNTIRAFDNLENSFSIGSGALSSFEMVCTDDKIREACHLASIELSKFSVETFFKKEIYNAFNDYISYGSYKNEPLNNEQKYYIEESIKDFKRAGFDLPKDKFLLAKKLKKEISEKSLEFEKNINTDNSFILVGKNELLGLEDDFINALTMDGDKFILKCDYPTYFGVMQNCTVSETRKKLYFLFMNRAYPKNIDNLDIVINKRDELAHLLGFGSYSDLDLDSEMAKKPERAIEFLTRLASKTKIKMDKEFDMFLSDLPDGVELDANGKMNAWDYSFVVTAYKKKHFNIDERKIAEYFPVENTIDKIFEIYQKFLSLKFELVNDVSVWHKDVKVAKIYDKDGVKLKGILFLDLYPRKNKYSHACMIDLIPTIKNNDIEVPSVILVIANFPKATPNKPALLKHNDVETFFHEFGHAMHGLLGQTELAGFSGTNVKRDFVELPSQMFEEWMWDKDILKFASSHYKTGESLPDDLIDKKIKLKKLTSGYFVTRQAVLSLISLGYFSSGQNKDTDKIQQDIYEKYINTIRFEPKTHFQASFGHLMGYSAKYYGYMWSKVFALDLFYKIKDDGLLNSDVGKRLINLVLGKGGSVDPDLMLQDFLGREPNQEAFLKDLGI